jgi:hypothetical protein
VGYSPQIRFRITLPELVGLVKAIKLGAFKETSAKKIGVFGTHSLPVDKDLE